MARKKKKVEEKKIIYVDTTSSPLPKHLSRTICPMR